MRGLQSFKEHHRKQPRHLPVASKDTFWIYTRKQMSVKNSNGVVDKKKRANRNDHVLSSIKRRKALHITVSKMDTPIDSRREKEEREGATERGRRHIECPQDPARSPPSPQSQRRRARRRSPRTGRSRQQTS